MAVSYLDSSHLIESVVRRAAIPENQVTFSNDDILAFANEEMMVGIVPSVLKMHEEFYVYPFAINLVSNQSFYDIPDRAIGSKIKVVYYQDFAGNLQEMARIDPSSLAFYQNRSSFNYPRAFYLENNYMVLVPTIGDTPNGTLLPKIFLRPNQLVTADRSATVTVISPPDSFGNIAVQVDSIPSVFSNTALYDITQQSGGHRLKNMDLAPISLNTTTNTLVFAPPTTLGPAANIPPALNVGLSADLKVGDIICLSNETIIPQCPNELHPILAQRVACRVLEAQKDSEGLQSANQKLAEMEVNLGILIDNRTEGMPQKVNNLRSALRSGKFRRRRSTY